jgi:predicted metal-dependent peptidase
MSTTVRESVDVSLIEKENVPIEKKKECLQTGIYHVIKRSPFLGTVLQCLDIFYSHQVPRAGIMFDAQGKKWQMAINPYWFCMKLSDLNREAVLLHEIYHVTHKHPMRAPFLKINPHKRMLMNIAMDMAINQYIQNLPAGCPQCPPKEEIFKGAECQNEMCPGGCIDVNDYYDTDAAGNKIPWAKEKPMEYYYHKLIERFDEAGEDRERTFVNVEAVALDPLDVVATGAKEKKLLTSVNHESLTKLRAELQRLQQIVLVAQTDPKDNGVYDIEDLGSDTTPFILRRHAAHCGNVTNPVYVQDVAMDKHQKVRRGDNPKGWVVTGQARAADSSLVMVDQAPLTFELQDLQFGKGNGEGMPQEFDSHQWDANAEESEMMDATEELVKRAMQKRGLSMDKLPGFVKELLQEIEARRAELNYRQLILSAIKKHASGFNREHSWTRPSRRFKNKAPGTRNGKLPSIENFIDTSGSISIEEANEFLGIVDEFLKVGSRKCMLGLWHTSLYLYEKYKLGDRLDRNKFQSGGTTVESALRQIYESKPDLSIVLTDGCFEQVDVESWLQPGEHFPQILWIISKEGMEEHPMIRLGETIKIPKSDMMRKDKSLEQ